MFQKTCVDLWYMTANTGLIDTPELRYSYLLKARRTKKMIFSVMFKDLMNYPNQSKLDI